MTEAKERLTMLKIHVSGTGDDANPGTAEKPLASIAGARDRLRDMRRSGKLPEGAVVTLHAGTYRQSESFRLESEDSGTAEGPVVFRAAPGEAVTLSGGVELPAGALQPVTDPAMLARLPAAARPHVRVADFGLASAAPFAAEITCNGTPLTLARWPKAGYARLAGQPAVTTPDGTPRAAKLEDGFLYTGDRPRRWQEPGEAWIHVWGNDWATARVQVAGIDLACRHALTRPPYGSQYGFPKNGRFFWFNILEELNEPGEYILDRKSGRLYVWLPEGSLPSSLECATLDQPLVELHDAAHIRFEGIAFRHGRSHGLTIYGGSDVAVTACRVSCLGGSGIVVEGGRRHAVRGCEVAYLGGCGISLSGGDRRTLERADHAAENNHVHHFAMWEYCYNAGVHIGGGSYGSLMGSVGIRIAHNRIHDCPHNGILYWGNDLEIENNDIYRVVMESTDAGAIYTGRDFARRGSLIRHNHLHHNGTGGPFGTMGIYLDDCSGGEQVVGNILEGHRQAIYMGGGTDTICENNLLVNCDPALHLDMRGILSGLTNICRERFYEVNAHLPPYSTHYPELAKIHAHYEKGEGIPPEGTRVCRNIAAGSGDFWSYTAKGVDRGCLVEERNLAGLSAETVDVKRGGLVESEAEQEQAIGFERIPVERIGLVCGAARATVPPVSLLDYRLVVETPWTWRDNAVVAPLVCLEIVNVGGKREQGAAELFVSPPEAAALQGDARLKFDLAPSGTARSAPLALAPAAGLAHLELGVRRLGCADVPVWHWLYLRHAVTAPLLDAVTTTEEAAAALAGVTPLNTPVWDGARGEVRLGLTATALAIAFDLAECDLRPRLDDAWWQEACIELFGFGSAHPLTEQIGLIPSGPGVAAQALWFHDGIRQPEAPGVQITGATRPDGYQVVALIPDRLLGWDRAKADPTLEISINSKPRADQSRERIRVFGVEIWQNERTRFARVIS